MGVGASPTPTGSRGELPGTRTLNLQIKSPLDRGPPLSVSIRRV